MPQTHFAAVKDGLVVGIRTSVSRHVGATGKFGPYTHAILLTTRRTLLQSGDATDDTGVISWHGSEANAVKALRALHPAGYSYTTTYLPPAQRYTHTWLAREIVEVVVLPRKRKVGQRLWDAPETQDRPALSA